MTTSFKACDHRPQTVERLTGSIYMFKEHNLHKAADEVFPCALWSADAGLEFNASKWDWIMDHQYQRLLMAEHEPNEKWLLFTERRQEFNTKQKTMLEETLFII